MTEPVQGVGLGDAESPLSAGLRHQALFLKVLLFTELCDAVFVYPDKLSVGKRKRSEDEEVPTAVEMAENTDNPLRCPVRLYEFYLSKW